MQPLLPSGAGRSKGGPSVSAIAGLHAWSRHPIGGEADEISLLALCSTFALPLTCRLNPDFLMQNWCPAQLFGVPESLSFPCHPVIVGMGADCTHHSMIVDEHTRQTSGSSVQLCQ